MHCYARYIVLKIYSKGWVGRLNSDKYSGQRLLTLSILYYFHSFSLFFFYEMYKNRESLEEL